MKILLVEDEEGLIFTLTDRLQSEGYEVTPARDGELGLNLALSEKFDLIILDPPSFGRSQEADCIADCGGTSGHYDGC